jgi:replicative DNA helicase
MISLREKVPITQLKAGKLTDKEYNNIEKCLLELSKESIYFIDGALFSPESFSSTLDSLVKEKGVRILYVDYLQLMISSHPRRNREQEISELMRYLKSVALDFKIPVIITSQMNRYVETRGGLKRPILSDLRESGTIEEIADRVLLLYRPEIYGIMLDEEGNTTTGKAEIIVAKNRLGPTGEIILTFDANFGVFENLSWDKKVFPSLNLPDNPFNEGPF